MFITYKITNKITGEYYFGSHKTDFINDDYMGSGKLIRESIKKYGIENHTKDIIAVFDNREDSINLEHKLIKERRLSDSLCVNLSGGGGSFDYINENMAVDRSAYGKMASHEYVKNLCRNNEITYSKSPTVCAECGKEMTYEQRFNLFCSNSCSASYNNKKRDRTTKKTICPICHKEFSANGRKYCSKRCYISSRGKRLTDLKKLLLENKEAILNIHKNGRSYREIAKEFNTSATTIKELLKGRISYS